MAEVGGALQPPAEPLCSQPPRIALVKAPGHKPFLLHTLSAAGVCF